jgi:hypothetical protein
VKKPMSFRLDEKLWVFIKNKPNKSRYIEELVKQDIQQAQVKPIVQSVIQELLVNESFFREMGERLKVKPQVIPDVTGSHVEIRPEPFIPKPPDPVTGYPCCQKTDYRCKHWEFDATGEGWVNTLTGEIRET